MMTSVVWSRTSEKERTMQLKHVVAMVPLSNDGYGRTVRIQFGQIKMTRPVVIFFSLVASYFATMWIGTGIWQKALVTAVLAALVFSTTLLVVSSVVQNRPWAAFWIANAVLIAFFGGSDFYVLAIKGTNATRFGGARLFDGHITLAGLASILIDVGVCVLSNLLGFQIARSIISRLNR